MIIPLDLMMKDKMMKKIVTMGLFLVLLFTGACPRFAAVECSFGSVHAWFRLQNDSWENATGHPQLQRGEVFEIKINVTPTVDLQVFFLKLHEFGTPVFEVVEGPIKMEQILECRQHLLSNHTYNYSLKIRVRPDTTWVNGYAPLEVFAQFNTNDSLSDSVNFDVVVAYIVDELWEGYTMGNSSKVDTKVNSHGFELPGFEGTGLLIAIVIWYILDRMKNKII
jgi:sarcinarray family protein